MKIYEHRRCSMNSGVMRAVVDGQFVLCYRDKQRQTMVACWFLLVALLGESAWALLILSSLTMRMNVRHYAWSAMTTIFALRKCWRILKSHAWTWVWSSALQLPKISLFSSALSLSLLPFPSFLSAFCLFIWEYDLSWWLREEIEKNVYFRKKMSLTCLNVFF